MYEMHKLQALHQRQKMVSPSTLAGMACCVVMEWIRGNRTTECKHEHIPFVCRLIYVHKIKRKELQIECANSTEIQML